MLVVNRVQVVASNRYFFIASGKVDREVKCIKVDVNVVNYVISMRVNR